MSSTAIATVSSPTTKRLMEFTTAFGLWIKMMESLPETAQDQVVEHLRESLADRQEELQWDTLFKRTQPQLIAAARRSKKEIAEGRAQPMDYDQL